MVIVKDFVTERFIEHFTIAPSSAVVAFVIKVEHNGEKDVRSTRKLVSSSGTNLSVNSVVDGDTSRCTSGTIELLEMMVHLVLFLSLSLIVHFRVTLSPVQILTLLGFNSRRTLST